MNKKLELFKIVNHVQVGHLYEHIFCMELVRYFRSHGLYSYVDYNIEAKTYYSGYVYMKVEFYTKEAKKHIEIVNNLELNLSSDNINGGLLQIMAEKLVDIDYIDDDKVLELLESYANKSWQTIESLPKGLASPKAMTDESLVLSNRHKWRFGALRQTITLDKSHLDDKNAQNLPLFIMLSDILRSNLQEDIADSSYCFTLKDKLTENRRVIKDVNLYRIDKRQANKLSTESEVTRALVSSMLKDGMFDRLIASIVSSDKKPTIISKDLANKKDIINMLNNISINFKLGKSSETINLADVVKEYK